MPGQMLAGRCTMAFYHIMGINDCIADDYDDYIKIAVKLGEGDATMPHVMM